MPLVLNNDPLAAGCNTYVSASEMATYVEDRCPDPEVGAAWRLLSNELKATYLVNATRSIDMIMDWSIGTKYSRDQNLDWPRYNAWVEGYLLDSTTFPEPVKDATCEMAIWAMQNNGLVAVSQDAAYDSIKVGPLTIDFNQDVQGPLNKYYPDIIAYLLKDYGSVGNPMIPGANMAKNVTLRRA